MSRWIVFLVVLFSPLAARAADRPPNVVLIFADDLGYSDVGCFGAEGFTTPNLDRLAEQGTRFTSFCVAQAVCTASRSALMTGCYSNRVSMFGALNHTSRDGIHPDELLLPEMLRAAGYATGCFGKWHLGQQKEFLPLANGFDEFLGLPYSNDNSPLHPVVEGIRSLPWIDGETIVELDPDQSQFTSRLTERAVAFIDKHHDRPFFLYLPHIMPHVPIFASAKFKGTSSLGLFGDVVQELDWGVGQVLAALDERKLTDDTLVIFASDNGPFLSYGTHAGTARPFRGGKLTTFEGGVRVSCIMRYPGHIPAGRTCDELVLSIDLMPTLAKLCGGQLSANRLDGLDAWPVLSGQAGAKTPHDRFYYYSGDELHAVRSGDWKLHVPHGYLVVEGQTRSDGKPSTYGTKNMLPISVSGIRGIASRHGYKVENFDEVTLYNLKDDVAETTNVAAEHADVVERLLGYIEEAREDLGDSLTDRKGKNIRPAAQAPEDRVGPAL